MSGMTAFTASHRHGQLRKPYADGCCCSPSPASICFEKDAEHAGMRHRGHRQDDARRRSNYDTVDTIMTINAGETQKCTDRLGLLVRPLFSLPASPSSRIPSVPCRATQQQQFPPSSTTFKRKCASWRQQDNPCPGHRPLGHSFAVPILKKSEAAPWTMKHTR